ncbi:MAG: adenylate kinase [Armatimonadota bacterium]|jgi:adenylate kinase
MTRLVLLGPPGSGKGTQASALKERWGVAHISSGDLLRANVKGGTELGQRAKPYMDRGDLVPDELILDMMEKRMSEPDAQRGFALDGFPRTVAQAEALEKRLAGIGQPLHAVIYLNVPEQELLRRLSGRRTCSQCNAIYQIYTMAPKVEGVCDKCDGTLIQREDEKEDVVRNRLQVYAQQTEPLLKFYRDLGLLHEIDGTIGVDNVMAAIKRLLDGLGEMKA